MENILFIELTPSEQETLQGGILLGGGEAGGEGESIFPAPLNSVLTPVTDLVLSLPA